VQGEALVADDGFSARYDLDRIKGTFSRPDHKLVGQSYVDKILVLNTCKGGVASAWMLHDMKARGMAPKAILFNTANPILAQGAALADMALCDRFEEGDVTKLINTGDDLIVDPDQGVVTITRKA
jgi:predicted aconitase with swiveling domain